MILAASFADSGTADDAPFEGHQDFLILKAAALRDNSLTNVHNKGVFVRAKFMRLMKHTSESLE